MEQRKSHRPDRGDEPENTDANPAVVAALFDERGQADVALSDLERNGVPMNQVGMVFPANGREKKLSRGKNTDLVPGAPATGYPGWTMGMAPWVLTGLGPVVVLGSLALTHGKDRPKDLSGLTSSLGLTEEAAGRLEQSFRHEGVLVTVEVPDKETIAAHILERNGGHTLPRSNESLQPKEQ